MYRTAPRVIGLGDEKPKNLKLRDIILLFKSQLFDYCLALLNNQLSCLCF